MIFPAWIKTISPLANTLSSYRRELFIGDLIAGIMVAIMLVPQAMAYAMLAGLPPQVGLYASIVPLILYSIFGTSNSLAVGPVAMVSLLVVSGVSELATPGSTEFIGLCLTLALMIGVLQLAMAAFRLGFLVNFISHRSSADRIAVSSRPAMQRFNFSVDNSERSVVAITTPTCSRRPNGTRTRLPIAGSGWRSGGIACSVPR